MNPSKVHIIAEDMEDAPLERCIAAATDAIAAAATQTQPLLTFVSESVRAAMDKEYGAGWSCVVGKHFGGYFTHKAKMYAFFRLSRDINVMVWRC